LDRIGIRLRRRYYFGERPIPGQRVLPRSLRRALGLDDPTAIGTRSIEIGSGFFPTAGHLHVDIARSAQHVEFVASADQLPFADRWAARIVAIHSLEHIPPARLVPTLREWHRVLAPGAIVHVSVPNGPAIMEAFTRAAPGEKWPLMGSLLGMYCGPEIRTPEELDNPADHQIVFDAELLRWALAEAGFTAITDLTRDSRDRHALAWAAFTDEYSLVAEATKP
jgi:SAM-dependent methyltransferase